MTNTSLTDANRFPQGPLLLALAPPPWQAHPPHPLCPACALRHGRCGPARVSVQVVDQESEWSSLTHIVTGVCPRPQGSSRMAVHWGGGTTPWTAPPPPRHSRSLMRTLQPAQLQAPLPPRFQTKVTTVGKNEILKSGKSGRAIFGTQTFGSQTPPPPTMRRWWGCPLPPHPKTYLVSWSAGLWAQGLRNVETTVARKTIILRAQICDSCYSGH